MTRRQIRGLLALFGVALWVLSPACVGAVCQGYEYQLELQHLMSWPERGLYVAHLTGLEGQAGTASRWFFLDRDLRRLAECAVHPEGKPSIELGDAARRALGQNADAVQRLVRKAAQVSPPEPEHSEGFDEALRAALVASGARPLRLSKRCLQEVVPCEAFVAGRAWTCEARLDESSLNADAVLRSIGCFEEEGRRIVLTGVTAHTGSDCVTIETWPHLFEPLEKSHCPECRTGFSPEGRPMVVPVLGLAAGRDPPFTPLGFSADGRLVFRYRAPSSPGGSGIGSFDPATNALVTRGAAPPRALRPLASASAVSLGGSFTVDGDTYTLVAGGSLDATSSVLELVPPGGKGPLPPWAATLVSERSGSQPLAAFLSEQQRVERLHDGTERPVMCGAIWHATVRSPVSPHLVAVVSVRCGSAIDLGFFSADLRDIAFAGGPDHPPAWPEGDVIGFSRSNLIAYISGEDPERTVEVLRLTDDKVLAKEPLPQSGATLRRLGIVPRVFALLEQGAEGFSSGGRDYHVACDGASIVLHMGGGRKVLGKLESDEVCGNAVGGGWVAVSPFEPRAAVLLSVPGGTRVFGAHLLKGFSSGKGR